MASFDQLIRFEVANSAVAFRKRVYGIDDRHELLRDLLGLANAAVKGPRFVFLGVDDTVGGDREIVGVPDAYAAGLQALYREVVEEYVDPPFVLRIEETEIDDVRVVVIVLAECEDPPYMLKKNVSNAMRMGNGWIRQGTRYRRLVRDDLQHMFEQKLLSQTAGAEVRVGFAGQVLETVLHLPIMRLGQKPSEAAGKKIRKLIEAKQLSQEVLGNDSTRIQRLVHAQLFGQSELYQAHGESTLIQRLDKTTEDFEAADYHYEYETRAHKLNLMLENVGGVEFERGTLVLDFPCMEGVEVADRIWPAPDGNHPGAEGYPLVDVGLRTMRVQTSVGPIPPGSKSMSFRQPLRLCLREPGVGTTIPVSYSLHGKSLRAPVCGTLRIHIVAD
jgi:hypothetical protein